MSRVILMRHGKVAYPEEMFAGITDFPLDKEWLQTARKEAEGLRAEKVTAIYSSELSRAHDTARAMAEVLDKRVQKVKEFNELDFGIFEAMFVRKVKETFPKIYDDWKADIWNYRLPQGESYKDVAERAVPKMVELAGRHNGETILIVCHSSMMKAVLSVMTGKLPSEIKRPEFGAKVFINLEGGNVRIEKSEGLDGISDTA